VDELLSEKEQIEKILQWWKENGAFVIVGLALGIGGIAGWNYWQAYKLEQAEKAGATYAAMNTAVERGDRELAAAELQTLESEFSSSGYTDQGRLLMARMLVEQGDLGAAADLLRSLVEDTGDPELALVARLRLARVLIADGAGDEALDVLRLDRAGAFAPRFHELRGDVFAGRGETEAAREEYSLALAGDAPDVIDSQLVQFKLDALGVPVSEAADEES
jgi:predicted negative regulator of RcsB-dependent stress response